MAMGWGLIPGAAKATHAETSVTYVNGTRQTVHVYVLTSETTFRCELMAYADSLRPGERWVQPVRLGSGAWVRVFAGTPGDPCSTRGLLLEDQVLGGQAGRSRVTIR
jgi:hypothetical protein